MFRNSLRRCANQATAAASVSFRSTARATLPIINRRFAPALTTSISPLNRIASLSRAYSDVSASAPAAEEANEAPVAEQEVPSGRSAEDVTLFSKVQGIHPNILKAINENMGYDTMTLVQAKTIDAALKGTDIVAQAKTGTGKTLAFLVPLLQRMLVEDPSLARKGAKYGADANDIRGIVMSPTRELAEQIAAEARRVTAYTGLVVQCAVGGTDKRGMLQKTRREGCHLLVATPGRLNDLLEDPRSGIAAPNLAAMVLDEADRMLDVGFESQINEINRYLPKVEEKVRQTMLVSATIPDNVIRLARSMVRADDFEFVQTIPENESLTHDKVPQHIVPVSSWTNIFPTLFELIDSEATKAKENPETRPFKAIVYLNTTGLVELGYATMRQRRRNEMGTNVPSFVIQSKLSQQQRQRAADSFRRASAGVLFSSDVTARGMDFPDVTHVIQVDAPRDRESYIHRLGRTGRQDKEGQGWILVPQISLRHTKQLLRGLPIEQNTSLRSPEIDVESGETSPEHQELKEVFGSLPKDLMATTYTSMFGITNDKMGLAENVNSWAVHGWGWSEPPVVSPRWAANLGLTRAPGMNIGHRPRRDDDDRRGSGDAFDSMSRNVRRDDEGSSRGFSRGGGGGGYSRGGGSRGGYSRDGGSRDGGSRW